MSAPPLAYESRPPRRPAMAIATLVGLLLLGVQLWLLTDFWLYRPLPRVMVYVVAIAACFIPWVQTALRRITALLDRHPVAAFAIVSLLSMLALYATAVDSRRQFTPTFHDEFSYLIQARQLAAGYLWMGPHPLGEFFETFYLVTDRAYASQYFPGAAMMFVPGVWLGLPAWAMPLVVSGLACGMLFLLLRELFYAGVAVAGTVVLVGVPGFRFVSIMSIAQGPALLLLLCTAFAIVRWDRTRHVGWMVAAGVAMGWFAVTRPLDAAVVAVACGSFVAWRLRREDRGAWGRVALAGLLPLVPFLAMQLAINRGVTGSFVQTPFGYYADRDMPGTSLGFKPFDASQRPRSTLPQKQAFFDSQVAPAAQRHTPAQVWSRWTRERLKDELTETLPDMLLVIVVPAGLLTMRRDPRRWMVVAIAPLWWIAYSFHPFAYFHYYVVLVPSTLVLLSAGFEALATLGPRAASAGRAMGVVLPTVITVMAMPQFKKDVRDQVVSNPVEDALRSAIESHGVEPRAIVLVRYAASAVAEHEVVYNADVAWPDDAPVIRAQDLGDDRNAALYRYYATRQPDRVVYRFDRADNTLSRLGGVADLAGLR